MSGESDSLTPPPAEPQALTFHDVKRWAPESRDQRVTEPKCTRSVRTALAFSDYKAVHPVGPDSDRLPVAMKIAETILQGQAKTDRRQMLSHTHKHS